MEAFPIGVRERVTAALVGPGGEGVVERWPTSCARWSPTDGPPWWGGAPALTLPKWSQRHQGLPA